MVARSNNTFDYYGYKSLKHNTIGSGCINTIFTDKRGITWVGSDTEGVFAINSHGERVSHFDRRADKTNSVPNAVMSIFEDTNGTMWLGSYISGLYRMNRGTGECRGVNQMCEITIPNRITGIVEDSGKNLWIATHGEGVIMVNLATNQSKLLQSTKNEELDWTVDRLHNDWVNALLIDSDGLVWIGTFRGLATYNPRTGSFKEFMQTNNLMPNRIIYSIVEGTDKKIWIGSAEGISAFDKINQRFTHYTMADGLASNTVCAMAADAYGNIWASTYSGISKLIVGEQRFSNYYVGDGIQGNEFSRGAVCRNDDGRLYFGGINGITAFYPRDIVDVDRELSVIITCFTLFNQKIVRGKTSGGTPITDKSIFESNKLQLASRDNTFSIECSAMEFCSPERIVYQYRIKELGDKWINTGAGVNRVTYSNLDAGNYTFQVRSSNYDKTSEIRSLSIRILPPWYRSWWATLIFVLLIALLLWSVWLVVQSRIERHRERTNRQRLEEINEAKMQYFFNVSHEIRNPMVMIMNPLEKLIARGEKSEHSREYQLMYRNAQRILRLMNQILDVRKLDTGQMRLKFR